MRASSSSPSSRAAARYRHVAVLAVALLALAQSRASAQAQPQPAPDQPQQGPAQPPPSPNQPKPAPNQPQQPGTAQPQPAQAQGEQPKAEQVGELGDDTQVQQRDYMADEQRPQRTGALPTDEERAEQPVEITHGAGVGSPIGYARQSVVELGGTLALTHRSETTDFRLSPSVGYFIVDNLELTLFPELQLTDVSGETDGRIAGTLEPSYHVPLAQEALFAFVGVGLGVSWAEDPGVDVFFRPKVGLDVLIGRSGILKPALFLDIGANDGLTAGGLEAGFTVMW